VRCLMSTRSKRPNDQSKLPLSKRHSNLINQVLTRCSKGRQRDTMRRQEAMNKATTTSCLTSSSYQCIKDIQKKASYCINTHSLMVQSIDSLINGCIFMIRMEKLLSSEFLTSNCSMTYTLNGSVPDYCQILRGNHY
jgi:hypothetical protein